MIKAKSSSIAVYFPFHSKQKLQRLQHFLPGLSRTSGLLQTELFAEAAALMVSVTSSAHCGGKKAPPREGRKKVIHTRLVGCSLSKQMSWLLQLELFETCRNLPCQVRLHPPSSRPEHEQYTQADSEGARENGLELKEESIRLDVRK